jgi:hypothetical protein
VAFAVGDHTFNIPPEKWVAISVVLLVLGLLRRATSSLLVELLFWAIVIAILTAIWHSKSR